MPAVCSCYSKPCDLPRVPGNPILQLSAQEAALATNPLPRMHQDAGSDEPRTGMRQSVYAVQLSAGLRKSSQLGYAELARIRPVASLNCKR